MPTRDQLQEFVTWYFKHIAGDENGAAQILSVHRLQSFIQLLTRNPAAAKEEAPPYRTKQ